MIIVITGPTGVGKTKLSLELAKKLNGEVINADSTQIYKGLDIATAKVKDKENIIHHLMDIKDINENYTLYDFQRDCRLKIDEIKSKNKTPIIVGGTGLYIKAALYNYELEEENIENEEVNEDLYQELLKIDPDTTIHKNNTKRIKRALDYYKEHGKLISENNKGDELLYKDTIFIGLTTDRENLYNIINKRVDEMLKEGLEEEAKNLYDLNIRTKAVLTPIGYKELFEYFDNNITKEEAIELIKKRSRNYAKRQYTWFNNKMKINWFNTDYDNFNNTVNEVLEYITRNS